jgi:hypothetical protein
MRIKVVFALGALAATTSLAAWNIVVRRANAQAATMTAADIGDVTAGVARWRDDVAAMKTFRPGYSFWQYVFTMPDHSIAFGSALDGRLIATFPTKSDWTRKAAWADPDLDRILEGLHLPRKLGDRRDQVARILENAVGPVLHNPTRGDALLKNAPRYGAFIQEWGTIYEHFGVPAEIGLAQVIFESGLNPTRRSEANAIGFCQWLQKNWKRLNHFSPMPIEGRNHTTQAPYCAAYLSVLATKYGSFIPALSEHNAGGTNVGRTLITGELLGAADVRARYFLGSKLARDLRSLPGKDYEEVYRTYGPRSYLYAEMVFGNSFNVKHLIASIPQIPIYAMRTSRAISLAEIMKKTGLSRDEIRRFNPALVDRVPARGTLYLPQYVSDFGADVAFWRRPAAPSFVAVLNDFLRLESGAEQWDDPSFAPVLADFKRRFQETNTEEGTVMDTVLTYAMDQAYTSPRRALLAEFRNSQNVRELIGRGVLELDGLRSVEALRDECQSVPTPAGPAVPACR